MELTPQLLTDEIDFRIAVRGYDRHEVDDFLERVAVAVGQLQSQLAKAVTRAKTAEARVSELEAAAAAAPVEPTARDAAEPSEGVAESAPQAPVEVEATPVPKAPPAAPTTVIGDDEALNDELRRTLVLAQRTADTAIREAHDEARGIIDRANDEARRNREAAEAAHAEAREEARARLVAEIRELEATREAMRGDTVVLERHLGTERARVRETIQVLRRLVDDPESFRAGPTPELSDATTPVEVTDDAVGSPSDEPAEAPAAEPAPAGASTGTTGDDPAGAEPTVETTGAGAAPAVDDEPVAEKTAAADDADPTEDTESAVDDAEPVETTGTSAVGDDVAEEGSATGADQVDEPPSPEAGTDADSLGQLFATSESARDWRSGGAERGDQGPHTQPVAAARFEEESDEAFLAELRRAMSDDEPLGPDNA